MAVIATKKSDCSYDLLFGNCRAQVIVGSVQRQLKAEDKITIVQALADVIKSDTQISVLEIDFFYQVANALRITLVEPLGLTA